MLIRRLGKSLSEFTSERASNRGEREREFITGNGYSQALGKGASASGRDRWLAAPTSVKGADGALQRSASAGRDGRRSGRRGAGRR